MSLQEDHQENQMTIESEAECCSGHLCCEGNPEMIFSEEENKELNQMTSPANEENVDRKHNQAFELFLAELEKLPDAEAKLRLVIEFMEKSLSQTGTPHFKNFWESRKLSLPLFKENISPLARPTLWARYIELSDEARRLRDILDEQSAFAAEQIDIAIKALEDDIAKAAQLIETNANIEFPSEARSLKAKFDFYNKAQKELNILNNQASRINGLRKELIRTEMRIRQKNKLFQRLSALGDHVFPRRKELIKEVSDLFTADINHFIDGDFSREDALVHSLFDYREEIKALQGVAKILTLNTQAFTHTRTRLSECWDKIKRVEKERKKERAKQREAFKENFDQVQQKIQSFTQEFEAGSLSINEANQQIEQIVSLMRSVELGRDELRHLRDQLNGARKLVLDKVKVEEQDRHQIELERDRQKREKVKALRDSIESLLANVTHYDVEKIIAERDSLVAQIQEATVSRTEKQDLEKLLKPLKDIITEKKEQAIMNLSADDQESLQQLKDILKDRKARRQEIKNQLEIYRKTAGASSGFDFEKAMQYNEQINAEKERLEKINEAIEEIEQKISDLKDKI